MNNIGYEQKKLTEIASEYRARGYEVFINPSPEQLPGFLSGFRPDLIARRKNDSVVVEMKVGMQTAASERFTELAETIRQHPGWRFSLVVVDPRSDEMPSPTQQLIGKEEIALRLDKADALLKEGATDAALLLMWTSVEALLRHIAARENLPLERVPSSSLIKEMYSQGILSRSALEAIQRAYSVRNALVHGFVADNLDENFAALSAIAQELVGELEGEA